MYGKKHSLETRRKISEAAKKVMTPERRKLFEGWKGVKFSAETRRKISEASRLRKKWIIN